MPELESQPLPKEETLDHILPELRPLARPMSELIPDPENARKHDARNIKMIAESLSQHQQSTPLTVNRKTGYIEKGNGTYMAAKLLGWTTIAWVYSDRDRIESLAYGLADNRSSDSSTFDYSQAGKHLREIDAADFPMAAFWTPEEAMPLMRQEFVKAPISDETFDAGLQKGRAISKISASERIAIDRAIAFVRSKSKKSLTEGTALELICGEFMAQHINELDNQTEEAIEKEVKIMALSLD